MVRAIFGRYDADKNGYLEFDEVVSFFSELGRQSNLSREEWDPEAMARQMTLVGDENGDDKISPEELTQVMVKLLQATAQKNRT